MLSVVRGGNRTTAVFFEGRGRFVAPAGEVLFVRDKKSPSRLCGAELILRSNVSGDQKARLRHCPAKLSSLLRRSAQTAAGNLIIYFDHVRRLRARAGSKRRRSV